MDTRPPTASEIIARLGGVTAVARMFRIKPPSACQWRTAGIPAARMMYLEVAHPEALAPVEVFAEAS